MRTNRRGRSTPRKANDDAARASPAGRHARVGGVRFGRPPAGPLPAGDRRAMPDWRQSDPRWIRQAVRRAALLPSGGWYAIDASRAVGDTPRRYWIAGRELVAWRGADGPLVAPNACPHLGASLADGRVRDGCVVCPWHGLVLGPQGHAGWRPLPSHDDGVLFWVRLDGEQAASPRPYLCARPSSGIDAVIRMEARCEPQDIIANRFDPWHGVHFHPHSFGSLAVLEQRDDSITVRVLYRATRSMGVEVDARFHCPDPRTIVMTIIDGEGAGSVVETHATPVRPGICAIVEATVATSERFGFRLAMRAAGLVRRRMQASARRLWVEDAAYAERRYALRSQSR